MKISRLYIKIFLSFLGVLLITEVVIFALFIVFSGRHFKARFEEYTAAKVLMVKEVVQDKIRSAPDLPLDQNRPLQKFITQFGGILGARVWLQSADRQVILRSFEGPLPDRLEHLTRKPAKDYGSFKLYHGFGRHFGFYAIIPIEFPKNELGGVHVLFAKGGPTGHESGFAVGLAIIGLIIAVLVIPVSRFITKPLKELNHTALSIAEGDLSHRAHVKSCDEIGELAKSFNHMADRLERMIRGGRELTANISHELRTPLARIRIAEELLRDKMSPASPSEWERHLNSIRQDIEELDRLIGQILDLSKLDVHDAAPEYESFDLRVLVDELLQRVESAARHKQLHITCDLPAQLSLHGDRQALSLALSNILQNAVKFTTPAGDVHLKGDADDARIEIEMTNTCAPLKEEDLDLIFEPFQRARETKAEGTGLGLAIAKKIIEKHGGKISARNLPEGLQIRIRLPIATAS